MELEDLHKDATHKHRISFEQGDETEVIGAMYRERVAELAANNQVDSVSQHELDFSLWDEDTGNAMLVNNPEHIADMLEEFHKRTGAEVIKIARGIEAAFDSNAISRRISLGKKALELANLLRGDRFAEELVQELEQHGPALFNRSDDTPAAEQA